MNNTETNNDNRQVSKDNFRMTNDILRDIRKEINSADTVGAVITSLTYERVIETLGGEAEVQNDAKLQIVNRTLNINHAQLRSAVLDGKTGEGYNDMKKTAEIEDVIMTVELQSCDEYGNWNWYNNLAHTFSDNEEANVRVVIKSELFGTPSNTRTFYIKNYDGYYKAFGQMYIDNGRGMIETFILDTIKNGMDEINSKMQERIDRRKKWFDNQYKMFVESKK